MCPIAVAGAILCAGGLSPDVYDGPSKGIFMTGFIPNRWRAQGRGSAGPNSLLHAVQDKERTGPSPETH